MKRIIIIGSPGSGKSTLARALHELTKIPLHYLDMMYWNADRTIVEKPIFRERLADAMSGDEWIIDGNYSSTMEMRIAACDTVIFLDYPTEVCLAGINERRGKVRVDMPWVELTEDVEFTEYVKGFRESERPKIIERIEKYKDEKNVIILKGRDEAVAFLSRIRGEEK